MRVYVCMCACMRVCACVCVCVRVYLCIYTYTYARLLVCSCTYTCWNSCKKDEGKSLICTLHRILAWQPHTYMYATNMAPRSFGLLAGRKRLMQAHVVELPRNKPHIIRRDEETRGGLQQRNEPCFLEFIARTQLWPVLSYSYCKSSKPSGVGACVGGLVSGRACMVPLIFAFSLAFSNKGIPCGTSNQRPCTWQRYRRQFGSLFPLGASLMRIHGTESRVQPSVREMIRSSEEVSTVLGNPLRITILAISSNHNKHIIRQPRCQELGLLSYIAKTGPHTYSSLFRDRLRYVVQSHL